MAAVRRPPGTDYGASFTSQAEYAIARERRMNEARAWAGRLAPSCGNCVFSERGCAETSLCASYIEKLAVSWEREIAAAAFEALTAEVQ